MQPDIISWFAVQQHWELSRHHPVPQRLCLHMCEMFLHEHRTWNMGQALTTTTSQTHPLCMHQVRKLVIHVFSYICLSEFRTINMQFNEVIIYNKLIHVNKM